MDQLGWSQWVRRLRPVLASCFLTGGALGVTWSEVQAQTIPVERLGPGSVDLSFNSGLVPAEEIHRIVVQTDGRIVLSVDYKPLMRLNSEGTRDPSFDATVDLSMAESAALAWFVRLGALLPDGRFIWMSQDYFLNGTYDFALTRKTATGTVDLDFEAVRVSVNPRGSTYPTLLSLSITPAGGILAGIDRGLYAFKSDGTPDSNFYPPARSWTVSAVGRQADDKLIIGARSGEIVRLNRDGSLDPTFAPDLSNTCRGVTALAIQPDGKILIAGSVGDPNRKRLSRFNADGTLDTTFDLGSGTRAINPTFPQSDNSRVGAVVLQPDGNVLLGGLFQTVDAIPRPDLVRIRGGELPGVPRLQLEPPDQSVSLGDTLTLQALASGSPAPQYQWQHGGVAISGATNRILRINSVELATAGVYRVLSASLS